MLSSVSMQDIPHSLHVGRLVLRHDFIVCVWMCKEDPLNVSYVKSKELRLTLKGFASVGLLNMTMRYFVSSVPQISTRQLRNLQKLGSWQEKYAVLQV